VFVLKKNNDILIVIMDTMRHRTGAEELLRAFTSTHIYPTPQHVVLTRMRWAGKKGPTRPDWLELYRILNPNFAE